MKTQRPTSPRISLRVGRVRRTLRGLAVCVLALGIGCASTLPEGQLAGFEGMRGPIEEFSRNPAICSPTAVGNTIGGLVGGPLALIVYPLVWPATWFTSDDDYLFDVYGTTFWGPVLLTGAIIGGPFYPLSMLFDDDPCTFSGIEPSPVER